MRGSTGAGPRQRSENLKQARHCPPTQAPLSSLGCTPVVPESGDHYDFVKKKYVEGNSFHTWQSRYTSQNTHKRAEFLTPCLLSASISAATKTQVIPRNKGSSKSSFDPPEPELAKMMKSAMARTRSPMTRTVLTTLMGECGM